MLCVVLEPSERNNKLIKGTRLFFYQSGGKLAELTYQWTKRQILNTQKAAAWIECNFFKDSMHEEPSIAEKNTTL